MIDITGKDKAQILAALYNNSKPQGLGHWQFDPTPMTKSDALLLLLERDEEEGWGKYFDYIRGRIIKTDFSTDELDPWGYDRDNGEGAMERIIGSL